MKLAAVLIYWVIILLWMTVLGVAIYSYVRNRTTFGTTRLLLIVVLADTARNIIENIYFGLYFGGQYGIFSTSIVAVLGLPYLLILPKILNVAAALFVLGILLLRWLPTAVREREKAERHTADLEVLASTDGLTGVYNRRHFLGLADTEWERFRRYGRPLSLLLLDIDFFKLVNDRYGHDVGDRVIVQIAQTCREQKRATDSVGRLGGEEFALLLPETNIDEARIVAERLRDIVSRHILALAESNVSVTISIGASEAIGTETIADLIKSADLALYQAKHMGRNRVCLFSELIANENRLDGSASVA